MGGGGGGLILHIFLDSVGQLGTNSVFLCVSKTYDLTRLSLATLSLNPLLCCYENVKDTVFLFRCLPQQQLIKEVDKYILLSELRLQLVNNNCEPQLIYFVRNVSDMRKCVIF